MPIRTERKIVGEKIECTKCGKSINLNKWELCLECRQVDLKCRCGNLYRGGAQSDSCPECRRKAKQKKQNDKRIRY